MEKPLEVIYGVCQSLIKQWFVWIIPVGKNTPQRLLKDNNPNGELTIKNIKLATYIEHLYNLIP